MKKLNSLTKMLLGEAVSMSGSYDPDESFFYIEERLTVQEATFIYDFLAWVHANEKTFGSANKDEVYAEFVASPDYEKTVEKYSSEGKAIEKNIGLTLTEPPSSKN